MGSCGQPSSSCTLSMEAAPLVESGGSSTTTCTLWIEAELWQRSSSCTQHLVHREGRSQQVHLALHGAHL